MNREEIRAEIARLIAKNVYADVAAEEILVFLEDVGFDYEASYQERTGHYYGCKANPCHCAGRTVKGTNYAANDPSASWNNPK